MVWLGFGSRFFNLKNCGFKGKEAPRLRCVEGLGLITTTRRPNISAKLKDQATQTPRGGAETSFGGQIFHHVDDLKSLK
jgi:hypothetical protein